MATERVLSEEEIKGAIDETDREIADFAFSDDEPADDDGDTTLEEMDDVPGDTEEGDDEPAEEDTEETGQGADESDDPDEDDPREQEDEATDPAPQERERVPSSRLREETERRQAIENELANARARIAAYENEQRRQSQPERQEAPQRPDMFSDPEGWAAHQRAEIAQEMNARHVNAALNEAHEEHGEAFVAAYRALTSMNPHDPMARAIVQRVWDAPNPGRALMNWHKAERVRQEIGNDPDAWLERKLEERLANPETRRETLARLRGEAMQGDGGRPRTQTRLPKSLNGASGGGGRGRREADPELYNDSDGSVFDYAMK
jgi:hypothetical protein